MMGWWNDRGRGRRTAWAAALCLVAPLLALPAAPAVAQVRTAPRPGMSTKQKVVVLAGAALVYYLYKKHQAKQQAEQAQLRRQPGVRQGGTTVARRTPQLYRSKNGGIYYRDPNGNPVWLSAPTRSLQVPVEDVRRYAPDYTRYRGPAPAIPRGATRESFEEFDPTLFENTNYNTRGGGTSGGGSVPPGPRRY